MNGGMKTTPAYTNLSQNNASSRFSPRKPNIMNVPNIQKNMLREKPNMSLFMGDVRSFDKIKTPKRRTKIAHVRGRIVKSWVNIK